MLHRNIRTRMLLSAGVAVLPGIVACGQDSGESAISDGEAQDVASAAEAADGSTPPPATTSAWSPSPTASTTPGPWRGCPAARC